MTAPDPRPPARVVDQTATRRKLAVDRVCRACGARAESGHHLIPKGARGDDVVDNVVPLCGDGTRRCHAAVHGTPYYAHVGPEGQGGVERRDGEWVRHRIGARLRPEELMYVGSKLGAEAGAEYLRRHYGVVGEG